MGPFTDPRLGGHQPGCRTSVGGCRAGSGSSWSICCLDRGMTRRAGGELAAGERLDGAVLGRALPPGDADERASGGVGAGSAVDAAPPAGPGQRGGPRPRLRGARAHRLGAAADRLRARDGARDRQSLPAAARGVAAAAAAARGRCGALSGRARAICCRWTPSAWRASAGPATNVTGDRSPHRRREARAGRLGVLPLDHRRPLPAGVHRDSCPTRRAATVTALRRARAGVLRRPRHPGAAAADRQRVGLHPQPLAARRCSPSAGSSTAGSRLARRSATARSSATSRPWPENGPTDSATAQAPLEPQRYRIWLIHYNTTRPHSAIGNRPPISRIPVRKDPRQNS